MWKIRNVWSVWSVWKAETGQLLIHKILMRHAEAMDWIELTRSAGANRCGQAHAANNGWQGSMDSVGCMIHISRFVVTTEQAGVPLVALSDRWMDASVTKLGTV
jgi:hypothetical protein